MIATQYQSNIQVIRTDNGGEFVNQDLKQYLNLHGIVYKIALLVVITCPYTPQQNGVAQRKNRHLLKVVRASLFGAHMPTNYWGEAITVAAYLINRVPSSSLQFQTPFDVLHHTVIFGCVAFMHLQKGLRTKLEPRALRCVFVGYALHQKTLQHPLDNLDFISGDNLETSGECPSDGNREEYPGENEIGGDGSEGLEFFYDKNQGQMEVQDQIEVLSVPYDVPTNQLSSPADFMPKSHSLVDSLHESHVNFEFEPRLKVLPNRVTRGKPKVSYEPVLNSKSKYPINNYEALKDSRWREAMNEEMKALQKNSTWEVVDLPEGKIPIGCRWKFAPMDKINIVHILLSLAVNLDWPLHQFDVKNAFLNGNLQEEVYMELSPGCNPQTKGNKQQSARAWFGRFTSFMKSIGYKQSNSDHTLFLKYNEDQIIALIVYVDDMIVTRNDFEERKTLQKHLAREFEMKDLVSRSKKGIFLSQRKYALDLLNEMGMTTCSPASTPMEENLKLCMHSNQVPANKKRYQRLVGRLMYLAHTRPDLAYALSVVSQFMHSPSEEHMNVVIRILCYLKSSPGKGILFTK
ncbi:hypothetical protein AAG906_029343 [Vitis piasezkii]